MTAAHTPTPQQLAGVIRGLDNACEYCDRTQAFDSARNIREAAAAIGLLRNSHDALVAALEGDIPEAPEISPLSWLRSAIVELRARKPADTDEDPSAYWEMVNELEAFHTKASAALKAAKGAA